MAAIILSDLEKKTRKEHFYRIWNSRSNTGA
jgi:hypothetical protein